MEDSLQLPDEEVQMGGLLSPRQEERMGPVDSKQGTPQHSLAYSNSTGAKEKREVHMMSPGGFDQSPTKMGFIKANNQNYPLNDQMKITVSPSRIEDETVDMRDRPVSRNQYKKLQPKVKKVSKSPPKITKTNPLPQNKKKSKSPLPQPLPSDQRKTITKNQNNPMVKRNRQLQQALHMETVISEELRTKLSITNSLLESRLKDHGLGHLFNLKNTSRDLKNIDIFVELTSLQKTVTQKNIIIDRLKSQLMENNLEVERLKTQKTQSPIRRSPGRSPNRTINEEIQKLYEQKQSLMGYIDEQKATLQRKIEYIGQLEAEINRLSDRESHYTDIERPKLIEELGGVKMVHKGLKEEVEKVGMQLNLCQLKFAEERKIMEEKLSKMQKQVRTQKQVINQMEGCSKRQREVIFESRGVQKQDIEGQVLIKQLHLLKTQRDYYLSEYRKRSAQTAQLYSLQLQLSLKQSSN